MPYLKLLSIPLLLSLFIPHPAFARESDLYHRGVALRDSGAWRAALDTWLAARDSLSQEDRVDPRIGTAFIQLATEKQATDYYARASEMYFWGFSRFDPRFEATYEEELARLAPLMPDAEKKALKKAIHERSFGAHLKAFWTRKDPIPTTAINERLIEHWERIAYVRQRFQVDSTTAYGTDDRGLVFVKYGAPNKTYTGKLGTDQMEIMRWFDDFLLRQEFQRYNTVPELELWIYLDLGPGPTYVFLFGKRGGLAQYGLRYGIEELIPDRAFTRSSTNTTRGVLPGAVVQIMYYSELMHIDPFFRDRYRELEALWSNARAGGRLGPDYQFYKGLLGNYRSRDRARTDFRYLPLDRTDAYEGLELLQLKYRHVRYLDEAGQPRLSILAVAAPATDDPASVKFFEKLRTSKIKYRHILVPYDENWNRGEPQVNYPATQGSNTSVFVLDHARPNGHYALVAEKTLLATRLTEMAEADIPDTAHVIGVGTAFLEIGAPLDSSKDVVQMSDLILGVDPPAFAPYAAAYAFPIVPRDPIRPRDPVKLYFEVYGLPVAEGGSLRLKAEYELARIKDDGTLDAQGPKRRREIAAASPTVKKLLPLKFDDLSSGPYQLRLRIKPDGSKQTLERRVVFHVVE